MKIAKMIYQKLGFKAKEGLDPVMQIAELADNTCEKLGSGSTTRQISQFNRLTNAELVAKHEKGLCF